MYVIPQSQTCISKRVNNCETETLKLHFLASGLVFPHRASGLFWAFLFLDYYKAYVPQIQMPEKTTIKLLQHT